VISVLLEEALIRSLETILDPAEMEQMGFSQSIVKQDIRGRIQSFIEIQRSVMRAAKEVAQFTDLEASIYAAKKHSFYFAEDAMISIFTDLTERSPTFGLNPIDTIGTFPKRSWIAMFTNADSSSKAWLKFLGRPFKGLTADVFEGPFNEITDADLKRRALGSLKNAGPNQKDLYDFSFSQENQKDHPIEGGDLALLALLPHEIGRIRDGSMIVDYLRHVTAHKAKLVVLLWTYGSPLPDDHESLALIKHLNPEALVI
jgi:N-acetylmuramic acid 6-phosphate etherase